MNDGTPRLSGWRHGIAVLMAIACLGGAVCLLVVGPLLWLSDDIALAATTADRSERRARLPQTELDALRHRSETLSPAALDAEVGRIAMERLPMSDYAIRPTWRRARKIGVALLIVAIFMIISSIGVFRAAEKSRRRLICCCVAVAAAMALLSADVSHGLATFSTDIMRDVDVASAAVRREIGVFPRSRPVENLAMLDKRDLQRVGWVLFATLSLPWQLAAVVLSLLNPTVRVESTNVREASTGE